MNKTKQERREAKRLKRRRQMKKHGRSIKTIYPNVIKKRERNG